MQVSIGYVIIEDENRVKKSKNSPQKSKNSFFYMFQDLWNKNKNYICIWSAFWKHGWILLKLGMQVSIEKGMIENKKMVKKSKNYPQNQKKN